MCIRDRYINWNGYLAGFWVGLTFEGVTPICMKAVISETVSYTHLSFISCPYRKPTQVDEERILRPTGEALLRNSAK